MKYTLLFEFLLLLFIVNIHSQDNWQFQFIDNIPGVNPPFTVSFPENQDLFVSSFTKKPGHYTREDWQHLIDSVWGPGLPTAEKLEIFDNFWTAIDTGFACFHNHPLNWDSLKALYRPQIQSGVSKGRFCAIIEHLALLLRESHVAYTFDNYVVNTGLVPGIPLFSINGLNSNSFGAGSTPLADSTILIYSVVPNHPLGLQVGDRILGYDRIPWKILYKQMLDYQLPIRYLNWIGGSPSSFTHSMLRSAARNWHLFDTIDIVKYSNNDTVHLPTSLMIGNNNIVFLTEQLDIPGVPKPGNQQVSYGIITGTNIGYIYGWSWTGNAGQEFLDAVQALMQTDGLIIDFRYNQGGNMYLSNPGLSVLFDTTVYTIDFGKRCSPNHQQMCPLNIGENLKIIGTQPGYDKPIAVLTGPGAVSSGDQVALRFKYHPRARFFGKSTASAFNSPQTVNLHPEWQFRNVPSDAYRLSNPNQYLTHTELEVDEEVWLTPDNVVLGKDDVVEAALDWINIIIGVQNPLNQTPDAFILNQNYPNPFNPVTKISFSLSKNSFVSLIIYDVLGREIHKLVKKDFKTGKYEIEWDASNYPSGVYFYTLQAGSFNETKKMVLVK